MTRYVILRHGSNGANQPLTQTLPVGTIEARNQADAVDAAAERWTRYLNQCFEAIAWSRATRTQRDTALEADQEEDLVEAWLP